MFDNLSVLAHPGGWTALFDDDDHRESDVGDT